MRPISLLRALRIEESTITASSLTVGSGAESASAANRFGLVELLARELSAGKLEVPGFPDVVLRVRRALEDPNCTAAKLATLVGAEPVLTARLLRLSNSAALRPVAAQIKDTKSAVSRLGFALVRSATMTFAVEQMRIAHRYEAAKQQFDAIWARSTYVGALAYVLAKRCTKLNPDEALLVGLMHAIGKLYILSRAEDHPNLFNNPAELNEVVEDWYVSTGEAILQNWAFSEDLVRAVAAQRDTDRAIEGSPDLGDVLIVALPLPAVLDDEAAKVQVLIDTQASARLGLSTEACARILDEAREQIQDLRHALGDS